MNSKAIPIAVLLSKSSEIFYNSLKIFFETGLDRNKCFDYNRVHNRTDSLYIHIQLTSRYLTDCGKIRGRFFVSAFMFFLIHNPKIQIRKVVQTTTA